MIMLREIVLGSIIIGAFIFGTILILIYLLRWLLYETTGDERKPRAEKPLDREESFGSLDTISSLGNEHPEVGEISGEGSTAAPEPSPPKPPAPKKPEEKKSGEKRPPKPKYNAVDDFIIGDDDSDSE